MAWDATKPPQGGPRLSAELRQNWEAIQQAAAKNNLAWNPLFEHWPLATAPRNWTVSGTGATVSEQAGIGYGGSSARLDYGSALAYLNQVRYASLPAAYQGTPFSLGALVDTTAVDARLYIDDGVDKQYSDYHTGGGAPEWLSLPAVLVGAATELSYGLELGSGTADISGVTLIPGPIPPLGFTPSAPVGTDGRLFLPHPDYYEPGVGVRLYQAIDTIQTTAGSGASPIDGHSYTIDADRWFSRAGDELAIQSHGYVTASTWVLRHYMNGNHIIAGGATACAYDVGFGGATIHFDATTWIIYVTASTQQIYTQFHGYLTGSGTHIGYRFVWPTTANANGAVTTGTGDVLIKETLSDADTHLRSHRFQVFARPVAR